MLPYIPIPVLVIVLLALAVMIFAVVTALCDAYRQTREAAPYPPRAVTFRVLIEGHPVETRCWEWAIVDPDDHSRLRPYASGTAWSAEDAQRRAFDSFSRWAQHRPDPSRYALAFPDGTVECL